MEGFLVLEESVHASEVKAQQLVLWVESLLNAKLQEQLASVVECLKQYMPNGAPNFGSTQRRQGTDTSVTSP